MKVFHGIVNYGTQAGFLAKGLRENGVKAKSYVLFDKFLRTSDVRFYHGGSLIRKVFNHLVLNPLLKWKCLFTYDIFHFYSGTSLFYKQLDLPLIKLFGKKVVHHYLGHDVELYKETKEKYAFSNMDNWTPEQGAIHDKKVKKRMRFELQYSDYQIVCAPQYSPFVKNATFVPLAIDLDKIRYSELKREAQGPIKIVHAPTNRHVKGTQFLIDAVEKLKQEGHQIELTICEGITHAALLEAYKEADFSVVSLMGGWYGTAGIEAMATGRGIIAYLKEDYFPYVAPAFLEEMPIRSANRDTIYAVLKNTLAQDNFEQWGTESRKFVEKYHDLKEVSKEILNIYKTL